MSGQTPREVADGRVGLSPVEKLRVGGDECLQLLNGLVQDSPAGAVEEAVPRAEVRLALAELDDAALLNIAAAIIAGWKPLLLKTTANLTDVDLLVEVLRDRAAQFAAAELDEEMPGVPLGDGDLRPIWTPEDARQAVRDAAKHVAIPGEAIETHLPFRRNPGDMCPSCFAWPYLPCQPGCLPQANDNAHQHRRDSVDRLLSELGFTQTPVPTSPRRGRHHAPERARMRPRRAAQRTKIALSVAAILMVLVIGVLWAEHFGALPS